MLDDCQYDRRPFKSRASTDKLNSMLASHYLLCDYIDIGLHRNVSAMAVLR